MTLLSKPKSATITSLLDSGSAYNIGPMSLLPYSVSRRPIDPNLTLVGASGDALKGHCMATLVVKIGSKYFGAHDFYILEENSFLKYAIVGMQFLKNHQAVIHVGEETVSMRDKHGRISVFPYETSRRPSYRHMKLNLPRDPRLCHPLPTSYTPCTLPE